MRYIVSPDFILREIGDEAVLIPVGDVGELENSVVSLNSTYLFLYKQFIIPKTVDEVIDAAKENYEDPDGVMEEQIRGAVGEFVMQKVLMEA